MLEARRVGSRLRYGSGRREIFGAEKRHLNPFKKKRKVFNPKDMPWGGKRSMLDGTPFKSKHRWKRQ